MSEITLGIIGGGQLVSMMAIAAKKLNIKKKGLQFCSPFFMSNFYPIVLQLGRDFNNTSTRSRKA